MKNLAKLLRTSAFRMALVFLALFAAGTIGVIGYIYWNTNILLAQQLNETIEAEVRGLAEQYRTGGIRRLVAVVETRSSAPGNRLYLVTDFRGRKLAGNLITVPEGFAARPGWIEFPFRRFQSGESDEHLAFARTFRLQGGFALLVGQDIEERRKFEQVIKDALLWALGLTIALGLGGGFLVSRRMLGRIDEMSETSRRIMAGKLNERISINGSGDELDRLAQSFNLMLDRIEQLMSGLKEVSDNIAHDLKTPLTRMRGRLEDALRTKGTARTYRLVLQDMLEESDALIKTFNALLSIARAEAGTRAASFKMIDAVAIARDVAELYEPVTEEHKGALVVFAPDKAQFKGDRELVSQALANLVDNALKYSVIKDDEGANVAISVTTNAHLLNIKVADKGPGIAAEDKLRVTDRFVRLEESRSRPGSGLGLSLVSAIATLHGGKLLLDDNNPGLVATISIPLDGSRATGAKQANGRQAAKDHVRQ